MQVTRLFASLAFIIAIVMSPIASGQIMGRPGQIAGQPMGRSAYTSTPEHAKFDPGNLDYDMQAFAPLDISEFDEPMAVDGGFFAGWDRTYLSVVRPRPYGGTPQAPLTAFPKGSDYQSGNLFTLGNMSDDGAGWDANYLRSSGLFFNEATNPATPRMVVTSLHFFELNRTFRQPLSRGGFIEPYFGFRYRYFQDRSRETTAQNFILPAGITLGALTNIQTARNSSVGGGVGVRMYQQNGRWRWTFDAGLDGGYNTQSYDIYESYDAPTTTNVGRFALNRSASGFLPNADISAQLSYRITRDVYAKCGAQLSYMWSGLTRVDSRTSNVNPNSSGLATGNGTVPIDPSVPFLPFNPPTAVSQSAQAATVAGFTFGIEWRR